MGIPKDTGVNRNKSPLIPSPAEDLEISQCTAEEIRVGGRIAAGYCVYTSLPSLFILRLHPWMRSISPVGQALIVTTGGIWLFFNTVEGTILKCAQRNRH